MNSNEMFMRKIVFPFLILFMFSCSKPKVSEEQRTQFDACKKELLDKKAEFIALGKTQAKQDSLREYISDLEHNNLDQLLDKYDVEEEQVVLFLYSVCQKAELVNSGPSVEETLLRADSMMEILDSIILEDSLRKMK
jgi:hypothetical protein